MENNNVKLKNIEAEDNPYIKILKIAYEKGKYGISQNELDKILISESVTGEWFAKNFTEPKFLDIRSDKDFKHSYVINVQGIIAYNNLNLHETKEIFELKPNFYGIGVNLKEVWASFKNKF